MDKPIENFWQIRLADVKTALEANNFEVFLAQKKEDVHKGGSYSKIKAQNRILGRLHDVYRVRPL
jgi:hypothetical protein